MKQVRSLLADELVGEQVAHSVRLDVKHALLSAGHNAGLLDYRLGAAPIESVFERMDAMAADDLVPLRHRLVEATNALSRLYRELDRLQPDLGV